MQEFAFNNCYKIYSPYPVVLIILGGPDRGPSGATEPWNDHIPIGHALKDGCINVNGTILS